MSFIMTEADLQRELIDYDSQALAGGQIGAALRAYKAIPWPTGMEPKPAATLPALPDHPLPKADTLIVTWTVDEGHALSKVLTPGKDSHDDYVPYRHNYDAIAKTMSDRSPAVQAKRLGAYWTTLIGGKSVIVFKSESHMSQDTDKKLPANHVLPNAVVWKQIVDEARPKLVISTGTAGGIGMSCEVGDVIVSEIVRFVSRDWLRDAAFRNAVYHSSRIKSYKYFDIVHELFKVNAGQLPATNRKPPVIKPNSVVATTDFFGFDTSDNYYGLRGLGAASEMGDAVLGMVMADYPNPPSWFAVRNVSDPQIESDHSSISELGKQAADIYKKYGLWSSICSAIVCWSLVLTDG